MASPIHNSLTLQAENAKIVPLKLLERRERLFHLIEIGAAQDPITVQDALDLDSKVNGEMWWNDNVMD